MNESIDLNPKVDTELLCVPHISAKPALEPLLFSISRLSCLAHIGKLNRYSRGLIEPGHASEGATTLKRSL